MDVRQGRAVVVAVRLVKPIKSMVQESVPRISIVIPVLHEGEQIVGFLRGLQPYRSQNIEIIVVDGGSGDSTAELAARFADSIVESAPGRAQQMNRGVDSATGDILLFLHADTSLPNRFRELLAGRFWESESSWGRFDVRLSGSHYLFRIIEFFINWRSRLTGIATGDQAIFIKRPVFSRLGGFMPIPFMEDIALCKKLKKMSRPFCIRSPVTTSSRRWEQEGILRTVLLMWRLRLAYFFGADPARLVHLYYR
jgi:rSAM/selenodomain-associated transferase 2